MIAAAEVRAARAFLRKKKLGTADISPRRFAMAAKELDIGFKELFTLLGKVYAQ
jgi:hypothetical protein